MAEQGNGTNSEIVYIDFSKTSMSITQFKIKIRHCMNVIWVIDWIESIPQLGLGKFDFAVSTGVLHHLKSSQKGLNIVNDVQLDYGGAELMVYGKYGRTSVYQIQELLRIINQKENGLSDEITNAKSVVNSLPSFHWFHHRKMTDLENTGDVGIYDLLLHKRDVAFSMFDLYSWLANGGYNIVDVTNSEDATQISLNTMIDDGLLYKRLVQMDTQVQHAIGEILCSIV